MKKLFFLSLIAISAIGLSSCSSGNAGTPINNENVTFYEVPLVCGAYADIGCGSRAKPALMDLEKNSSVKEAWLNRRGTVFAIVWKGADETKTVANPIFNKYEIEYTALKGNDAKEIVATFRKENLWYKGIDVDKLSLEEATHIANTLANFALERKLITQDEADKLTPRVENYFKTELVKVRTPEELYADSQTKFSDDLIAMSEGVLGAERTKNIMTLYSQFKFEECKKNASCGDKKSEKKDCCKKK
jgi:hypothetical protein